MSFRAFAAGTALATAGAALSWLATLRGRVESEAEMKARAHQRGREYERDGEFAIQQFVNTEPVFGGSGFRGPPDPPAAAGAAVQALPAAATQTSVQQAPEQAPKQRRRR